MLGFRVRFRFNVRVIFEDVKILRVALFSYRTRTVLRIFYWLIGQYTYKKRNVHDFLTKTVDSKRIWTRTFGNTASPLNQFSCRTNRNDVPSYSNFKMHLKSSLKWHMKRKNWLEENFLFERTFIKILQFCILQFYLSSFSFDDSSVRKIMKYFFSMFRWGRFRNRIK